MNDNITNLKIIREQLVFVEWENTEDGKDKKESFQRVSYGDIVVYVNRYNSNSFVTCHSPLFEKMENIYRKALQAEKQSIMIYPMGCNNELL